MTVQQLRDNGFKVSVAHYRLEPLQPGEFWMDGEGCWHTSDLTHQRKIKEKGRKPYPRGGMTFVAITSPDGVTSNAYAACSMSDNYCKKTGRDIAIGRALKKLRDGGDTF